MCSNSIGMNVCGPVPNVRVVILQSGHETITLYAISNRTKRKTQGGEGGSGRRRERVVLVSVWRGTVPARRVTGDG